MPIEYDVGDFVQIKDWDEMVEEFGYVDVDRIGTPTLNFLGAMKHLCGQVFQIREKVPTYNVVVYRSVEGIERRRIDKDLFWDITSYMIKPVEDSGSETEFDFDSWQTLIQS